MEQGSPQIPEEGRKYIPQSVRGSNEYGEKGYMEEIRKWAKMIAEHRKMIDEERVFMKGVANSGKDIKVVASVIEKSKERIFGFEEAIKDAEGEIEKIKKKNEEEIT